MPPDFTSRIEALVAYAPAVGLRFARQNDRYAAVYKDGEARAVILQITIGQDRRILEFAISQPSEHGEITVSRRWLDVPNLVSTDISQRDKRYFSVLLSWAETALPFGKIRKKPATPKVDSKSLSAIIDLVIADTDEALRSLIFDEVMAPLMVDERATSIDLARRLCLVLRDRGWLAQIDWHDDDIADTLTMLHARRGVAARFDWVLDDQDYALEDGLEAYLAWLRPHKLTYILPASDMDSYFVLVTANAVSGTVARLFTKLGLGVDQLSD
jgi:hypothetical protein